MLRLLMAAAVLGAPAAAIAQESDGAPPQRIRNVQLRAGEPCPASQPGEIVVCAPVDAEPYRIPKQLREVPKQTAPSTAWSVKADRAIDDSRRILPGSCSPIGMNGQSGCGIKAAEQWAAEQRAKNNGVVEPQ